MRQEPIGNDLLPTPLNAVVPRAGQAPASLFWRAQYVRNDTILWQLPFLFWVLETAMPRQYVEIGVGTGVAYMAACQSLHRLQTDAQCHAVGVWKAGDGGIEVPAQLTARNADLYGHFSQILTEGPEKSHRHFASGSVDLMLVDLASIAVAGTPPSTIIETLREKWLSKLSEHGLLLIHGIGKEESALAFVDDLSGRMPAIRLPGGEGIIALLYGTQQAERIANIAALPADHHIRRALVEMFDRLGAASYYEVSGRVSEDRANIVDRDMEQLRKEYQGLAAQLEENLTRYEMRHRQVANLQAKSFDLEMAREAQRVELDRLVQEMNGLRAERDRLAKLRETDGAMRLEREQEQQILLAEAAGLKLSIEQHEAEILRLSGERDNLRQECSGWASQLEIERRAHARTHEEHQTALNEVVETRDALDAALQEKSALKSVLEEAIKARNALEATASEEFASHLHGTKMLTQALEQNQNVAQALTLELRFVQDQLAMAQENERDMTARHDMELSKAKASSEALKQNESAAQALAAELRHAQEQLAMARENEAALMALTFQERRTSPLQRFTTWSATRAQSDRG